MSVVMMNVIFRNVIDPGHSIIKWDSSYPCFGSLDSRETIRMASNYCIVQGARASTVTVTVIKILPLKPCQRKYTFMFVCLAK
jgi:hypothetical protein